MPAGMKNPMQSGHTCLIRSTQSADVSADFKKTMAGPKGTLYACWDENSYAGCGADVKHRSWKYFVCRLGCTDAKWPYMFDAIYTVSDCNPDVEKTIQKNTLQECSAQHSYVKWLHHFDCSARGS